MHKAMAVLAALWAIAGAAQAQDEEPIVGKATVADSDALRIGKTSVMLWGIESVERPQTCKIKGEIWECYAAAVRALETISFAGDVTCQRVGKPDGYGRVLAVCFVAGTNINEALVRAGFALAKPDETEDYVAAEAAAKAEGIGLWQGEFMHPRDFRHASAIRVDRP